jgi:secondary thiamine-phosphate synthase enzyme
LPVTLKKIAVSTRSRAEVRDITREIRNAVRESKVKSGTCHIFVPHTTAAVAINENADASVKRDILDALGGLVPRNAEYAHTEGNSDAHIKSSFIGSDRTVFIEGGELLLGTWQGIFFMEFDGPRQRDVLVKIVEDR